MSHIFISYSRKDLTIAEKIINALAKDDLEPWIDWKSIPKGEKFEREIQEGIEKAEIFLFLVSPYSAHSDWCNKEINHAIKNGKRILPIVIRETKLKSIHPEISKRNWILCRDGQDDFNIAIEETRMTIHTNYEWLKHHTELQVKALKWEKKKDASGLLRGKELRESEKKLAEISNKEDPQPTKLQREYILAGQRNEIRTRRQITFVLVIALGIMAILSFTAWSQRNSAINSQNTAIVEANARATAQTLSEQETRIARARELLAISQTVPDNLPARKLLLTYSAFSSLKESDPQFSDIQSALRLSMLNMGGSLLYSQSGPVTSLALSSSGRWLASSDDKGNILIQDMENSDNAPLNLIGNKGFIWKVVFSPNEKWLTSSDDNGNILIWDMDDLKEQPAVKLKTDYAVVNIEFSPKSDWLVSQNRGDIIQLWDTSNFTGKTITYGRGIAFSPNGNWLATSAGVWDLRDLEAKPRQLNEGSNLGIEIVTFSHDGNWLAMADPYSSTVYLWNTQTSLDKPIVFKSESGPMIFSNDDRFLITSSKSELVLHDLEYLTSDPFILQSDQSDIYRITASSDGNWVIVGSNDASIYVWNLNDVSSPPIILRGQEDGITGLVFSPDDKNFISSSRDGTLRIWDMHNLLTEPKLLVNSQLSTGFTMSHSGYWFVEGVGTIFSDSGLVMFWRTKDLLTTDPIILQGGGWNPQFSPDDQYFATGDMLGNVFLWDVDDLKEPLRVFHTNDVVGELKFSPDGHWLVAVGTTEVVQLINLQDLQMPPSVVVGNGVVDFVNFSQDSHWLVFGGGYIRVIDLFSNDLSFFDLVNDNWVNENPTFSKDGKWFAYTNSNNQLKILNGKDLKSRPVFTYSFQNNNSISNLVFSPDGKWMLVEDSDNKIHLWDTSRFGQDSLILTSAEDNINYVTFSPDGRWLAAEYGSAHIYLWDMLKLNKQPILFYGKLQFFSPDSHSLISIRDDGSGYGKYVQIWDIDITSSVQKVCSVVGRNFTQIEWKQYFPDEPYHVTCPQWPAGE